MYDLIGDVHGHADELVQLLAVLGYRKSGGVYSHPQRKAIFLGDFIDRGPKIRQGPSQCSSASATRPEILADNVACLDFSVAKGGFLCAYRWNGEQKLNNQNFAWVAAGE